MSGSPRIMYIVEKSPYQSRRMQIRVCRYKNVGVAGYAEAFMPVQSDLQTSEWYSYFENDVLDTEYITEDIA